MQSTLIKLRIEVALDMAAVNADRASLTIRSIVHSATWSDDFSVPSFLKNCY